VGVYIPKFNKILAKFSVLGVLYPYCWPVGVKFGTEEWTLVHSSMTNFTLLQCVSPVGEQPQNCPLGNLNTSAFRCTQCAINQVTAG